MKWRRCLALAAAVALVAVELEAQTFPSRPIHLIVPVPAGGPTDMVARRVGEQMSTLFGQPVIVENKTGAGGMIAAAAVAKSPPDGHTLLAGFTGIVTISPALYKNLPINPLRDLQPIALLVRAPLVLATNPAGRFKSLDDVLAAARAQPGSVSFGSSGNGSSMHLAGELLAQAAGVRLNHIPYRGSVNSLQDLLGGQIDTAVSDVPFYLPHLQNRKVIALAVTSKRRHPLLPEVPALAERFPGFETTSWQGLFAPAGTPAAVIERLNRAAVAAIESPELRSVMVGQGYSVETGTPAEFKAFLADDAAKWARIVKVAGVTAE